MFAATGGTAFRQIRVYLEAPQRSEELSIAPSLEDSAARVRLYSSNARLARIWRELSTNGKVGISVPVHIVRVDVLRTEFSPGPLEATDHPLRAFSFYVDKAPGKYGE